MNHSDSLAKIAPALLEAQKEIRNALKDSNNPHFGNTFASLTSVISAVKPSLNAQGITIIQIPGYADGTATMETMLLHESGEFIGGVSGSPVTKKDPQGVGSAITYLRRYSLAAVGCIGQEDDDGNEASEPDPREAQLKAAKVELLAIAKTHADALTDPIKEVVKNAYESGNIKALTDAKEAVCEHLKENSE